MTIDLKVDIAIMILMSVYCLPVKMVALALILMGHTSANALSKRLVFIANLTSMNAPGTRVLKIKYALTKKMAFSVKTVAHLYVQMKVSALIR